MKSTIRSDRRFHAPQWPFAVAVFIFLCGFILFFLNHGDTTHDDDGKSSAGYLKLQHASANALGAINKAIEAVRDRDYGLTEKHLREAHRRLLPLVKKEQVYQIADGRGEKDE